MLSNLRIRSFAIIDELDVSFREGFNVLTGETGAGKSIIIEALNLLLGGRAHADLIRTGESEAVVEGCFSALPPAASSKLASAGIEAAGEIIIRRIFNREGRSRIFVNAAPVTLSTLEDLTTGLVDISGQHEHLSLLRQENQLDLLDRFADLGRLRDETSAAFFHYSDLAGELRRIEKAEKEREARIDYLDFWLKEIDLAQPKPGEEASLMEERKLLANAGKLHDSVSACAERVYASEDSASIMLGSAVSRLREAVALDSRLSAHQKTLEEALSAVEEAGRELEGYARQIRFDPERLSRVEERLQALQSLCRKHGGSLDALLLKRDEMNGELASLKSAEARKAEVAQDIEKAVAALDAVSLRLAAERRKAAKAFEKVILRELARLAMEKASFAARISPLPAESAGGDIGAARPAKTYSAKGTEVVEFLISPNPGEELRPLARIASGGELSRMMLAVKRVLMEKDPVDAYVFDEVDAGIGGSAAGVVGKTLAEVGRKRQVICITHLPQIAVHAGSHFLIIKEKRGGRTCSRITPVSDRERVAAVAAMLDSASSRAESEALAERMLSAAKEKAAPARKRM